jgi:hypothetical protein
MTKKKPGVVGDVRARGDWSQRVRAAWAEYFDHITIL